MLTEKEVQDISDLGSTLLWLYMLQLIDVGRSAAGYTRFLRCTDTVSVSGPQATAVSIERWVERVQPVQCDIRRLCHVITVDAVFLQNLLVAVGGNSCLCWAWGGILGWSGSGSYSRTDVLALFGVPGAEYGNERSGSGLRGCGWGCGAFCDADVVARE
jgi:hypothetical protein